MIKMSHQYTEDSATNFSKLEQRLMSINNSEIGRYNEIKKLIIKLVKDKKPTLIMATGGSKTIAHFLKLVLEDKSIAGIICEVIEPRDYYHKDNIESYSNLIVISASGKTNGVEEALKSFTGNKYLITEKEREGKKEYEVIPWGNKDYESEKSFISLTTSLGPISLLLDYIDSHEISRESVDKVNQKIRELLRKSKDKIENLDISFKDTPMFQIMSGYETSPSAVTIESNLIETGIAPTIIHDKGSFCHGRSNLMYRNPNSQIIYLAHEFNELDELLLESLKKEYKNIQIFTPDNIDDNKHFQEFSLLLQMYFLSRKIADDKGLDLTQPDYNPNIVKKVYTYRGKM